MTRAMGSGRLMGLGTVKISCTCQCEGERARAVGETCEEVEVGERWEREIEGLGTSVLSASRAFHRAMYVAWPMRF